jgi:hypothetical protein
MVQNTNCVAMREYLAVQLLFTFDDVFQKTKRERNNK